MLPVSAVVNLTPLNLPLQRGDFDIINFIDKLFKVIPLLFKEGLGVVTIMNNSHKTKPAYKAVSNLKEKKELRKQLRNNATPAERKLWKALQGKKLDGFKFRRQHSIDRYILDFFCPTTNLAIELDGDSHYSSKKYRKILCFSWSPFQVLPFIFCLGGVTYLG
jgi:very-short-patch-repair endonuclease